MLKNKKCQTDTSWSLKLQLKDLRIENVCGGYLFHFKDYHNPDMWCSCIRNAMILFASKCCSLSRCVSWTYVRGGVGILYNCNMSATYEGVVSVRMLVTWPVYVLIWCRTLAAMSQLLSWLDDGDVTDRLTTNTLYIVTNLSYVNSLGRKKLNT